MADSVVISDISLTLQTVLTEAFASMLPAPPPIAEVHDMQGNIPVAPPRLTIFLFEVVEDASMRNQKPSLSLTPANLTLQRPAMPLILRYLFTPWSGDRMTDQRILGRTLQALHNRPVLAGPDLQGGLSNSSEAIYLKFAPLTLEERTRVWSAIDQPYRLSVVFEARVASIDVVDTQTRSPVASRSLLPAVFDENE